MIDDTYSVIQAARMVGVSSNTIRTYSKEFSQFLSPGATPGPREERRFVDEDIAIFVTVKTLRARRQPADGILDALLKGERYEPADSPQEAPDRPQEPPKADQGGDMPQERALATLELMEQFAKPWKDRTAELETKLDEAQEARLLAEVDRARLAGQLDAIYRQHWYQIWKPERPPDDDKQ
jgi:DNA-binding transcriptional MerR regulator